MGFRADDLTDLLTARPAGPAQPVTYRQGVIKSWDPVTGRNVVAVGGTDLVDLPILNSTESLIMTPGAVVGILAVNSTWAILGRFVTPGSPNASSALLAISGRIKTSTIPDFEACTSGSYGDLATLGPQCSDVLVGPTGAALIIISSSIDLQAGEIGRMSFEITGATQQPVDDFDRVLALAAGTSGVAFSASRVIAVTGLNAGLHTFTAKYRSVGALSVDFSHRMLTIVPI